VFLDSDIDSIGLKYSVESSFITSYILLTENFFRNITTLHLSFNPKEVFSGILQSHLKNAERRHLQIP